MKSRFGLMGRGKFIVLFSALVLSCIVLFGINRHVSANTDYDNAGQWLNTGYSLSPSPTTLNISGTFYAAAVNDPSVCGGDPLVAVISSTELVDGIQVELQISGSAGVIFDGQVSGLSFISGPGFATCQSSGDFQANIYNLNISDSANISGLSNGTYFFTVTTSSQKTAIMTLGDFLPEVSFGGSFTISGNPMPTSTPIPGIGLSSHHSQFFYATDRNSINGSAAVGNIGDPGSSLDYQGQVVGNPNWVSKISLHGWLSQGRNVAQGIWNQDSFDGIVSDNDIASLHRGDNNPATITETCTNLGGCNPSSDNLEIDYNIPDPLINVSDSAGNGSIANPIQMAAGKPVTVLITSAYLNFDTSAAHVETSAGKDGSTGDPDLYDICGTFSGSCTFNAPSTPTTYEFRVKGISDDDYATDPGNFVSVFLTVEPPLGSNCPNGIDIILSKNPANPGDTVYISNSAHIPNGGSTFYSSSNTQIADIDVSQNFLSTHAPGSTDITGGHMFGPTFCPFNDAILNVGAPTNTVSVQLTANPNPIPSGSATTLTWTPINATYCTSSNLPAGNWSSGQVGNVSSGSLTSPTTYGITCYDSSGNSASDSVTVNFSGSSCVSGNVTLSQNNVYNGDTVNIDNDIGMSITVYSCDPSTCYIASVLGNQAVADNKNIGHAIIDGVYYNGSIYCPLNPASLTVNAISTPPPPGGPTAALDIEDASGNSINTASVGNSVYLNVNGSTDSSGIITSVKFCSDDAPDSGTCNSSWVSNSWTTDTSDWNSHTKKKTWSFATAGNKNVYVEVDDSNGKSGIAEDSIYIDQPGIALDAACGGFVAPVSVATGSVFPATVTFTNSGTQAWAPPIYAFDIDWPHNAFSIPPGQWASLSLPTSPVNPGKTAVFNSNFTAPSTPNLYSIRWQMRDVSGGFGQICQTQIDVKTSSPPGNNPPGGLSSPNPPSGVSAPGSIDYCAGMGATINWTYSDPDNNPAGTDPQKAFEVILTAPGFSWDSNKVPSGNNFYSLPNPSSLLQWGTTYSVKVRTWDSGDNIGSWSTPFNWTTPLYQYPGPADFTPTPASIAGPNTPTHFTDTTNYFSGGTPSRLWTFTNLTTGGVPSTSTSATPTFSFPQAGIWNVSLVASKGTYSCAPKAIQINVGNVSNPPWKEVPPTK